MTTGCRKTDGNESGAIAPSVEVTSKLGIAMVVIPGGTFEMGSEKGRDNESPVHVVMLDAFVIDKYEATQDLLAKLQIPDPSQFKDPRRPIEQVRWSDAAMFCNERSRAEGLEPCYDEDTLECNFDANGYRLPTEAEWEYACRAGAPPTASYGFSGGEEELGAHACYAASSGKRTKPAGKTRGNVWGLCDMHGNVAEWCHDVYTPGYYAKCPAKNPRGPESGKNRVIRGGSWHSTAEACRSTYRHFADWGTTDACFSDNTVGFRCVRRATPEEIEKLAAAAASQ